MQIWGTPPVPKYKANCPVNAGAVRPTTYASELHTWTMAEDRSGLCTYGAAVKGLERLRALGGHLQIVVRALLLLLHI